jgi:hypothetical protein
MDEIESEDWENLHYRMDNEGFDYCFLNYSNFEEIKDDKFHQLRLKYIETSKELRKYIEDKFNSIEY